MNAHDDLDRLLLDHDVEPSLAAILTRAIAEWAKDQDEDWPWDDGTPAPESVYPPMPLLKNPEAIIELWHKRMESHAAMSRYFLDHQTGDNPVVFQQVTHRELGHPVNDDTQQLTSEWTQRAPAPEHWQPSLRICPDRRA